MISPPEFPIVPNVLQIQGYFLGEVCFSGVDSSGISRVGIEVVALWYRMYFKYSWPYFQKRLHVSCLNPIREDSGADVSSYSSHPADLCKPGWRRSLRGHLWRVKWAFAPSALRGTMIWAWLLTSCEYISDRLKGARESRSHPWVCHYNSYGCVSQSSSWAQRVLADLKTFSDIDIFSNAILTVPSCLQWPISPTFLMDQQVKLLIWRTRIMLR
jgi:hypothetical protein